MSWKASCRTDWQDVPELWDAVRFQVDQNPEKGQFLLTGSSTPTRKGVLHSGAGRIATLNTGLATANPVFDKIMIDLRISKYQNSSRKRGVVMITIRPVSDLRNKFPEVEQAVLQSNQPVFLTKNGYGTMVLMSIAQYSALAEDVETSLDQADAAAGNTSARLSHEAVFSSARQVINETL
ncbi:type II toxin-antitoxin system Phd/YefM family antitoxin [Mobiluncus mulieris]|uniref:type II toxin-antitoxin system Phd/YefM family antitoxin n=1 Tax=Mobiluncus mulieris TaxID=2052 RepID=UPI00019F8DA0|nr:type II toxin-antitoxin system Phd/YefM family antitoxin [Mobiluncus mulieris]EEJ54690.1 prevent-host-death family protein [Mobiluncus mulieris ATCC 35243]